jgi:hypothetical protein
MDIFKGQQFIEFSRTFQTEVDCKKYLAELKWKDRFTCHKCCHQGSGFSTKTGQYFKID